jgi:hypothetical protein
MLDRYSAWLFRCMRLKSCRFLKALLHSWTSDQPLPAWSSTSPQHIKNHLCSPFGHVYANHFSFSGSSHDLCKTFSQPCGALALVLLPMILSSISLMKQVDCTFRALSCQYVSFISNIIQT